MTAPRDLRKATGAPRPEPHRPPESPGPGHREPASRAARAADRLGSAFEALARAVVGEPVVERFAEMAARAREPEEVRVELVRLASTLAGASRVELYGGRDGRPLGRLACWPPSVAADATVEPRSEPRGPMAGPAGRPTRERRGSVTLQIPLRSGDAAIAVLRLTANGRTSWPARVVRRLDSLCAIAAVAERALGRPAPGDVRAPGGHRELRGSEMLAALLTFAQAQARRRHEPLSLLDVGVDRLDSIRELLGDELAEAAVDRVERAIRSTIRASDVVVRLEDGRIAVLLPTASAENAAKVAEAIRLAVSRTGVASTTMPTLTASIGIATYPDGAQDASTIRAAASSALTRARDQGADRIVSAIPLPTPVMPGLAHRAG